jgi:hypothetical protein
MCEVGSSNPRPRFVYQSDPVKDNTCLHRANPRSVNDVINIAGNIGLNFTKALPDPLMDLLGLIHCRGYYAVCPSVVRGCDVKPRHL